jgi:hypothetical protein
LLEANVKRRPALTLEEVRCIERVVRVSVSETILSRLLRRMSLSEKRWVRLRDELMRAAWRALVAGGLDARCFMFVGECSTNTSLTPLRATNALIPACI